MSGGPVDGRTLRAERNRRAVLDAALELLAEGRARPTAQEVADRAGVALRTVFHHFGDTEGLFLAVADAHVARVLPTIEQVPPGGPLAVRVAEFVRVRRRTFELMTPVRRAARLFEGTSPKVVARLRGIAGFWRGQIEHTFEPELRARKRLDREELLDAAVAVSGWEY